MAKTPTMKAVIRIEASTQEAEKQLSNLEKIANKLTKDGTTYMIEADTKGIVEAKKMIDGLRADSKNKISLIEFDEKFEKQYLNKYIQNAKGDLSAAVKNLFSDVFNGKINVGDMIKIDNGDISKTTELKNQTEQLNNAIREKQALLDETQSKIKAQADEEIAAAKRVQDAYEKYLDKQTKGNAKKFVAEYDSYTNKYEDFDKLDYTSPKHGMQTADIMDEDFGEILEKYKLTNEELDKLSADLAKKQGEVISYSDDDLAKYKAEAEKLKAELKQLTAERESLVKEMNSTEQSEGRSGTEVITPNISDTGDSQKAVEEANKQIEKLQQSINEYESSLNEAQEKAKQLKQEKEELGRRLAEGVNPNDYDQLAQENIGLDTKLKESEAKLNRFQKAGIDESNLDEAGFVSSLNNIQQAVDGLVASINIIGSSFGNVTTRIANDANKQVSSIQSIAKVVTELSTGLKNAATQASAAANDINSVDFSKTLPKQTNEVKTSSADIDELNAKLQQVTTTLSKTRVQYTKTRNELKNASQEQIKVLEDELAARQRLQILNQEYHKAGTKSNAGDYAIEYAYYQDTFKDMSKIGYESDNGTVRSAEKMADDFNKIINEYNISKENLDNSIQLLKKQYNETTKADTSELQVEAKLLRAEVEKLQKQRDSLKKQIAEVEATNVPATEETSITGLPGLQESVNELVLSIARVGTSFSTATSNITSESNKQIESITSVKKVVDELSASLTNVGVNTIGEFANFQKEFAKLQKEQQKLNEQKEAFKKQQEDANKKNEEENIGLTGNEMVNARNSIIEAGRNTKGIVLDENSVKVAKDGMVTYKAVIEETADTLTVATVKAENFSKAITAGGKLSKKYLNENTISIDSVRRTNANQKDYLTEQFMSAANKSNFEIDEESFKIDNNGVIQFTRSVEDAEGKVKKLQYRIENLSDVITKSGQLRQSFMKNGGVDIASREKLNELVTDYENIIELRRKIEQAGNTNLDFGSKALSDAMAKEQELSDQLDAKLKQENLTREEAVVIQNRLTEAKEKELELYDATENNRAKINSEQRKYDKNVAGIDSNDYADIDVVLGGEVVNLRSKLVELQTTATAVMDAINKGTFETKEGFEQATLSLDNTIQKIRELTASNNLAENSKGTFLNSFDIDTALSQMDIKELEREVEKVLSQYNEIVENVKVGSNGTTATADVINDGQIQRVRVSLEEYQAALDQTAVKVRALYGVEKEYQTFVGRWVSGFKAKIGSLTQYITGLDLVMRVWNEAQQGFQFVKELDTTLTTIYQTMDITKQELAELGAGAIQMGQDLGTAGDQVMDAVDIYAAYGETVDSILNKASPTVMLANAAQTDVGTASQQIQAVVQQYKELEGQESRVVNAYEKLAANIQIDFPKGIQTIAEGVQVAGSVAEEAGK